MPEKKPRRALVAHVAECLRVVAADLEAGMYVGAIAADLSAFAALLRDSALEAPPVPYVTNEGEVAEVAEVARLRAENAAGRALTDEEWKKVQKWHRAFR